MEMISHDNVRVHPPTEFSARFGCDDGKRTARPARGKDVALQIAAVDHVIPSAGKLNADSSSDAERAACPRRESERARTPNWGILKTTASLKRINYNNSRTDLLDRGPVALDEARQVRLQRGFSPFPFGEVHRVYFDRYSGEILGHLRPDTSLASRYLAQLNSELHYGTIGGATTKILWFAACALVPFFAVTA